MVYTYLQYMKKRYGCRISLFFFLCFFFQSGALFLAICYIVGAKTCTLLNFGAKICHLHCSSIVEAQPCWVRIVAFDAIIVLVGLGFI